MKLTKSKLKQLIQEELEDLPGDWAKADHVKLLNVVKKLNKTLVPMGWELKASWRDLKDPLMGTILKVDPIDYVK
jgi:hypothetical protein